MASRNAEQNLRRNLKAMYGITLEEYEELVAKQNGTCKICELPCATGQRLSVDHNHETGEIRGLLCRLCNLMLGYATDDPTILRKGADYLE